MRPAWCVAYTSIVARGAVGCTDSPLFTVMYQPEPAAPLQHAVVTVEPSCGCMPVRAAVLGTEQAPPLLLAAPPVPAVPESTRPTLPAAVGP